jgi:undecaprenyl-diphosphatase
MPELIYIKVLILALIQGLTEFLPISSSAFLVVAEEIINLNNKNLNLLFNISVHSGSLLAVLIYFKKEILSLIKNHKLLLNLIITTIPVVIVGFIVKILSINIVLQNVNVIASATIIFSIILFLSDKTKVALKFEDSISNKNALIIGLAQVLALIPGTSRSGITMTAARYLGFSRVDASKFSFLISIPVLSAATFLGLVDATFNFNKDILILLLFGCVTSFIFSYLCIKIFLSFVEKNSLTLFVILRLIIGLGLFTYILT